MLLHLPATTPRDVREAIAATIVDLPSTCAAPDLGPGQRTGPARQLRIDTDLDIYFCDRTALARGSTRTHGLLRQYFEGHRPGRHDRDASTASPPP